ncbi:MAG TPA: hypothetical protein VGB53_12795 [Rubricoccaceae bacterium]
MSRKDAVLTVFNDPIVAERDLHWKQGRRQILDGMLGLVKNYPPKGKAYTLKEARFFVYMASLQYLSHEVPEFVQGELDAGREVDLDRFPSVRAMSYVVFYKFYADRRRAMLSDVFDILISTALPYVDTVITESHLAEVVRRVKRRDGLFGQLEIATLKDLR